MNAGILPVLLLFFAIGLSLSFAALRGALLGTAAVVAAALLAIAFQPRPDALEPVFVGLWVSMIATVGLMHLPKGISVWLAAAAGLNAGAWAGSLAAVSSMRAQLIFALPILLVAFPGRMLVGRGYSIALKVVGSWVVAVATLAIFVSLTPTPGYKPDHMQ